MTKARNARIPIAWAKMFMICILYIHAYYAFRKKKNFYSSYLPVLVLFLLLNAYVSYIAFPHVYDFHKPGVDVNERQMINLIGENISKDDIIQLNPGRSFYEGYRIAYYSGHTTTEKENISNYLYHIYQDPPPERWSLVKNISFYQLYISSSFDLEK